MSRTILALALLLTAASPAGAMPADDTTSYCLSIYTLRGDQDICKAAEAEAKSRLAWRRRGRVMYEDVIDPRAWNYCAGWAVTWRQMEQCVIEAEAQLRQR